MDGLPENDLMHSSIASFANKWLEKGLNEICESPTTDIINISKEIIEEASKFCFVIKNGRFKICSSKDLNTQAYIEACKMDYIQCAMVNGSDCGCNSIAAFAEECFGKEGKASWRDYNLCR